MRTDVHHATEATRRKHVWKPFSVRIEQTSIDVAHRITRTPLDEAETGSYFAAGLEKWTELNLTIPFVEFLKEVESKAQSLPQIVHHQAEILDVLLKAIAKQDALALDALLDLLVQLIRDLGSDFEPCVARTLDVLLMLAKHKEVEVIEMAFNTMAYLFKYLNRVLSTNLIPVYTQIAGLLSQTEQQKPYITRFAAESLSFLLRRTKGGHQSDVIAYILDDVQHTGSIAYLEGVCVMFTEAIKGVEHAIHARGLLLLQSIVAYTTEVAERMFEGSSSETVCLNITTSLLHHSMRDTFAPILEFYQSLSSPSKDALYAHRVDFSFRLLYVCCAVRKGTRITDWPALLQLVKKYFDVCDSSWNAARLASVLFTYTPLELLVAPANAIVQQISGNTMDLLAFSIVMAKQRLDVFEAFVLPKYQQSVNDNWSNCQPEIVQSLIQLNKLDALTVGSSALRDGKLRFNAGVMQSIADQLDAARITQQSKVSLRALVDVSNLLSSAKDMTSHLLSLLSRTLEANHPGSHYNLLIGSILAQLAQGPMLPVDSVKALQHCHSVWRSAASLRGVAMLTARQKLKLSSGEPAIEMLIQNLALPGHERRLYSLQVLSALDFNELDRDLVSVCEIIESTDLTIDATRALGLQIRKLTQNYPLVKSGVLRRVIQGLCMGLLTTNYTPFWDMCSDTLASIAQHEPDVIWAAAKSWFDEPRFPTGDPETCDITDEADQKIAEASTDAFRCFNTAALRQNCVSSRQAVLQVDSANAKDYKRDMTMDDATATVSKRSQAIRVFGKVPELAERHARELVPVFLEQLGRFEDEDEDHAMTERFSRKERVEFLALFTKFNNPAAFPQVSKFRSIIMDLLSSGDSRVQMQAFTILMHFRDAHLRKYEDNLKNLLSEQRSRDEIVTFLQTDADETMIESDHRPEVIPVVARILYGKMITRRHANSQKKGLGNSRTIVLSAIASMPPQDLGIFLQLFLKSFTGVALVDKTRPDYVILAGEDVPLRKQLGYCTMMEDTLEQLAGKILPYVEGSLDALLYCFVSATQTIETLMDTPDAEIKIKAARSIRHSVYHTLNLMFTYCRDFTWQPYMKAIFQHFVDPRLEKLPNESSQNPSGVLKLLGNWASSPKTSPFLVQYNQQALQSVYQTLTEKTLKDSVAIFVLNLVQDLLDQQSSDLSAPIKDQLIKDKVPLFLDCMTILLQNQQFASTNNTINADFLNLEIQVLSGISAHVQDGASVQKLLDLLMPLLQKPNKVVQESVKEDILSIVANFLPLSDDFVNDSPSLWSKFNAIGSLFAALSSRSARASLVQIVQLFAQKDQSLVLMASILEELNAFSKRRLDTPDFDRRLAAFARLNEEQYMQISVRAWRPLLYNMIFFIGDEEELAIRTNAAYTVRRLLERVREADDKSSLLPLLETDLYPAMKKGMRHKTELIRQEWVGLLGTLVKECSFWPTVADLEPLLVGNDEEASFFANILHIQQHRRMRALRRLANISTTHEIQSNNIAQLILPLIEHYCFMPKEESHNLVAETIKAVGVLSRSLKFNQYSALLKRYIGLLRPDEKTQAIVVRLVAAVVDALVGKVQVSTELVDHLQDSEDEEMNDAAPNGQKVATGERPIVKTLHASQPSPEKVQETVMNGFLPHLIKYLHSKDDETVHYRIPAAVTAVKLIATLPEERLLAKLPGVLTDVCHILRSRSQESRDMTRKTLGEIASLLGPKYFSYILAELKGALQRGYQLHVLGFAVHTMLVKLEAAHGSLDYCVSKIVDMLIDDIFGETGKEKEADDYISKMKELKTNKSYDSFELVASGIKLSSMGEVIFPLRTLLAETGSLKVIRKVDEVLRRLTLGLLKNEACHGRDALLLCYNIYAQTLTQTQPREIKELTVTEQARKDAEKNFVVDLKARKQFSKNHFAANAHKLLKFALETLRSILGRFPDLQTPENLAAFVPLIGDSMMSGFEDVHMAALKLLTQIVKVDLKELDAGAPVFIERAVGFIRGSPSTQSEICQASLKYIAAILRERREVPIKDSVLAYLLIRIRADLEEPDRQGVTFSMLRSIMARKIMVPELYDLMDAVGTMMITNQSQGPRDMARSAYYQFLLDYPQGKGRLKTQLTFLVKNVEYVHASGRKSVMECLLLIVQNFGDSVLQEYLPMLFLALTMVLINDDEATCREMAGALIKKILLRADESCFKTIVQALKSWAYNDGVLLQRAAFQAFGLLFEVRPTQDTLKFFVEKFTTEVVAAAEAVKEEEADDEEDAQHWQVLFYGLQTFGKLLAGAATTYIAAKHDKLWQAIIQLMLYKHAWIRLSSSKLVGLLFSNAQASNKPTLHAGKDLILADVVLVRIARQLLIQLRSPLLSDELGTQITKNLVFLLRFFNEKNTLLPVREDAEEDDLPVSGETCTAWLLKRVATQLQTDRDVKRETTTLVRTLLLKFLAVAIQILSAESVQEHATLLAKPLYKYAEADVHNPTQGTLKDLSQEVLALLKAKLGTTLFSQAYNAVRQAQVAIRQERKEKRTIEAVANPERGAQKKMKAGLKKKVKRAEVAKEHKLRRTMRQG
ncbi:armadillo-type protein [Protomyces lactucae-debilis]|uniref:Armadillo-type protein n=1 Tax=Protomyces lactucae-debilis TaxID=2754530 RepID=A0A1Y2F113_PROLT|nr:armadillo-type protein [Protomyces lactucae-debilis]ORY77397.1 armadillo-type protein [Protomyces lactucae-debilis]